MINWLQRLFSARPDAPAAPAAAAPPAAPGAPSSAAAPPSAPAAAAPVPAPALVAGAGAALVSFEQRDRVNGAYFDWLFEAGGASDLDVNAAEAEVLDTLETILASQQSGAALVRRMPGLIPQLLQSLRSDTFSGAQLARTISSDVVLVAAVIRLANNSVKGSGSSINSVEHAVMLIGHEGLRHLITSVAFRPIIDIHSGRSTRLLAPRIWDHSERSAAANRMLAEEMGVDPFEAFLAGLVQNVGLIVSLRLMDQSTRPELPLGSEMFCARLVQHARALTCSIGHEWHFPDSVTLAISEQAGMKKGVVLSPLGRLLALSDYLGKLRILAEQHLIDDSNPALFKGLPASAAPTYQQLDALVDDSAPAAPAAP
jgi:HD-like signal output (HDOD) protein